MKIVNECRIDFQYKFGANKVTKTIYSNEVVTNIIYNLLKINEQVDKKIANIFEIITYTITVINISNIAVNNIYFKDSLNEGLKFIYNTVYIDGIRSMYIDPNNGFEIGTIQPKQGVTISFKAIIIPNKNNLSINNNSDIIYDYIYNLEMAPLRIPINSNSVYTEIKNNLFKQLNINYTFKLDYEDYHVKEIKEVKTKINIMNTKLVATPIKNTKEYIDGNLYNLIILGTIEYTIIYDCFIGNNKDNIKQEKIIDVEGFSTFLLVPDGAKYCEIKDIKNAIEDVSYSLLNDTCIFVDITFLLSLMEL